MFVLAGVPSRSRAHGSPCPHGAPADRLVAAFLSLLSAGSVLDICIINYMRTPSQPCTEHCKPCAAAASTPHWPRSGILPWASQHTCHKKADKETQTAADLSMVPLQDKVKALKEDLQDEEEENHIMQGQLQEAGVD